MSKSATNRKLNTGRYVTRAGGVRLSDRVEVKSKSAGRVVVFRLNTGRFTTERSAKAVDRTVVRYSAALKRLAKR